MKQFLIGIVCGLLLAMLLAFVPIVRADDDSPRSYKQYLFQMLRAIHEVNSHLINIENNTKALRDKLHA